LVWLPPSQAVCCDPAREDRIPECRLCDILPIAGKKGRPHDRDMRGESSLADTWNRGTTSRSKRITASLRSGKREE